MNWSTRVHKISMLYSGKKNDELIPVRELLEKVWGFVSVGGTSYKEAQKHGAFKNADGCWVMTKGDAVKWAKTAPSKPVRLPRRKTVAEIADASIDWEARYKGASKKINELQEQINTLKAAVEQMKAASQNYQYVLSTVRKGLQKLRDAEQDLSAEKVSRATGYFTVALDASGLEV